MSDLLTIYIDMELKALKKEYQNQTCIRLIFYLCTLQTNKNNNKQTPICVTVAIIFLIQ